MRSYIVAMVLLFIAFGHPSLAQSADAAASAAPAPAPAAPAGPPAALLEDEARAVPALFDVGRNFSLDCTPVPADGEPVDAPTYAWRVNGTQLERAGALAGRYRLEAGGAVLALTERMREDDHGVYGCLAGGGAARAWRLLARPLARLAPDSSVVEGQQLRLSCKLIGKPYPNVTWTYRADEAANATDALRRLGERGALAASAAGVPGGELTLRAARRDDAGIYSCVPEREGGVAAATVLRVKDMYAALWPFLGICLEVLVLCAIILVYERRRTKPDAEDSDTDNHEQ